jgi:heme-degrading monooxygenase HmoA
MNNCFANVDNNDEPYYAVIFANQLRDDNQGLYGETADRMVELAEQQPGFLGVESTRDGDGFGITVSYWKDRKSIKDWRDNAEHLLAQKMGRERFYATFSLRIAKVGNTKIWKNENI